VWTYEQATGILRDPTGKLVGTGYSGAPGFVNDWQHEEVHGVGPCPRGVYTFGPAHDDGHLGTLVMDLTPVPPFDAYGRTLLRIHGDNPRGDQSASNGCIVQGHTARTALDASTDRQIQVV
jgi:hypothetical protein